MIKLYTTTDSVLLNLLKSELEMENISVLIKNEFPPAAGEVPRVVAYPELWILNDEDAARAQNIVEENLKKSRQKQAAWICTHCGEPLEGQFELCWKCGNPKE